MIYQKLRLLCRPFAWTPLHPQWLLRNKHKERQQWLASYMSAGTILDVGCGNRSLQSLLPDTVRYIGLDYPKTSLLGYLANPEIYGDGQSLPFADSVFDAVALLDVLEHMPRPGVALEEAIRVTVPGGVVICHMPFMYPLHDLPYDFQRWTAAGFQSFCSGADVKLEEIVPLGNSIETAVMLGNLSLLKAALDTASNVRIGMLLLPVVIVLVPIFNVLGWLVSRVLDDPGFMPMGYTAILRKPIVSS